MEPPEGVICGENVPRENDNEEFWENYARAKAAYIKSLERKEANQNG